MTGTPPQSSQIFKIIGISIGALTLIFFMILLILNSNNTIDVSKSNNLISIIVSLGLALSFGIIGADAVIKGQIPIPYFKNKPVQFSLAGGAAIFLIVFIFCNNFIPQPDPNKKGIEIRFSNLIPKLSSPVNGAILDFYPRNTVLTWEKVDDADYYYIEIEIFVPNVNKWFPLHNFKINSNTYTFEFNGAQPCHWRVTAFKSNGEQSKTSDWWEFTFTK